MATKQNGRPTRWRAAVAACQQAREKVNDAASELAAALTDLYDIQQEYQEWRDGMPENLEQSATAEKLDAILDLSLDNNGCAEDVLGDWDSISTAIDDAESAELPLGFGRD